ncbi:RnfH family protein [Fulvimonas soli]|jgi:putative ubiquitin-RnfH superfamily antitoxin RatB of RatAB toxin-antitoxin module|uniref:UPF0125 protein C7456_104211 n=1 Tax=Fulvimonas soli TaxID=155197 RepID=A0A316I8P3_9GAMM|nr:RnfH family protein [Fulvimonas soli]PWK89858.1 hypothetical protein C7456_104211 [Fulvimonas soli]TNY27506.1 hypothetical protein BV497_02220 [Fulvimonas soli]
MAEPLIRVEVVLALPGEQHVRRLEVPGGTTAGQAVALAGWAGDPAGAPPLGIFARRVAADHVLRDGDRVEIYRPLLRDPKEARRQRASR